MHWHVFSSPDQADTHITVEDITRHDDHSTFVSRLPESLAGGAVCDVCDDGNDGEKVRISLHYYSQHYCPPWLPAFTFTSRFPYYELERIVHFEIGLPSRLLARFECTPSQRVLSLNERLFLLWYIRSRGQPCVSVDQE